MRKLVDSKKYQSVMEGSAQGSSIPYYLDTGEPVTPDNLETLIDRELLRYQHKLLDITAQQPDFFFTEDMLRQSVRNQVSRFLGSNFLKVGVVHVDKNNIDHAASLVEALPDFHSWCVE